MVCVRKVCKLLIQCVCVTGLLFKVCRLLRQCVFVCYRFILQGVQIAYAVCVCVLQVYSPSPDEYGQDSPRYTSPKPNMYGEYFMGK